MGEIVKLKKNIKDFDSYLSQLKSLCEDDLLSINSLILDKLDSKIPLIHEIASHLILSGGKRIRPLLTSCCFRMCKEKDNNDNNYLGLAAAVEFIHAATLLHDDVIDESKKRRGEATANQIWGNKASVLVGDFLFSRAFQLMAKAGSKEILKLLADTSVKISEGEVLELTNDNDPTVSENKYFNVIEAKTASLFSAACQVGAMVTDTSPDKIEALKSYGLNFGMSYQLIDDAIDYSSNSSRLGKNVGDDFSQGKVTLPIILAYLRSNKEEKAFWKKTIQDLNQQKDDFKRALHIISKYNCINDTVERAYHFASVAKDSLGNFKETEYKNSLINLINSSISRVY